MDDRVKFTVYHPQIVRKPSTLDHYLSHYYSFFVEPRYVFLDGEHVSLEGRRYFLHLSCGVIRKFLPFNSDWSIGAQEKLNAKGECDLRYKLAYSLFILRTSVSFPSR